MRRTLGISRTSLHQGARYALAGGCVAGVYVLVTLSLARVALLPFQLALAIGLVVAVTTHFILQRLFVWRHSDGFELPIHRQIRRYIAVTLIQYALTALSTSLLPSALGLQTEVVYLVTVACLTLTAFLLMRANVFHPAVNAQ